MKSLTVIALILSVWTQASAGELSCRSFSDNCRASFCGGVQAFDTETGEVIRSFRLWDNGDPSLACEQFVDSQNQVDDQPESTPCTDFEWEVVQAHNTARCTRSLPGRCRTQLHGYSFTWLTPGGIDSCVRTALAEDN